MWNFTIFLGTICLTVVIRHTEAERPTTRILFPGPTNNKNLPTVLAQQSASTDNAPYAAAGDRPQPPFDLPVTSYGPPPAPAQIYNAPTDNQPQSASLISFSNVYFPQTKLTLPYNERLIAFRPTKRKPAKLQQQTAASRPAKIVFNAGARPPQQLQPIVDNSGPNIFEPAPPINYLVPPYIQRAQQFRPIRRPPNRRPTTQTIRPTRRPNFINSEIPNRPIFENQTPPNRPIFGNPQIFENQQPNRPIFENRPDRPNQPNRPTNGAHIQINIDGNFDDDGLFDLSSIFNSQLDGEFNISFP